jgi:tripartite-type tricarboxylate transporter receptor subunit TctC
MNGKESSCGNAEETVGTRKLIGPGLGRRRSLLAAATILCAFLLIGSTAATLCAQTYPNKPIKLILPFPPGGATDILGRIVAQKLAEQLGQPVVSENHPGAAGNIGVEYAAKQKPDGYTIVLAMQTFAVSPLIYKKVHFDPLKDLAPISLVAQIPNVLVVRPSLPVKNLRELVSYAKANPGKLNFGSGGIAGSSHLAGELLKSLAKINLVHVPYKGANQAMLGVIGNEVDMVVIGTPASIPQINAGKVRALAVLQSERAPSLPDVPTADEAGVDNFHVINWYGLLAPAGTPRDIINRLNAEWIKIEARPDTKAQIEKTGTEPLSSTPEKFSEFIKVEIARWSDIIKEAKITID